MVEVTEENAAADAIAELKSLLHAKIEEAKQEELVRVDSAPVHKFVGGALDLLAEHFGQLEGRCKSLEKDVAGVRAEALEAAEAAAAEAAAAAGEARPVSAPVAAPLPAPELRAAARLP